MKNIKPLKPAELTTKVQAALEGVYSGADRAEAVALLDKLEDQGLRVVRSAVPEAATRGMAKLRSAG